MKRELRLSSIIVAVSLAAMLMSPAETWAQKKGGKPGGGGGSAAYTIIPFMPAGLSSASSYVGDINEQRQAVGGVELGNGTSLAIHLDLDTGAYTTLIGGSAAAGVNYFNETVGDNGVRGLYWRSPSATPVELPPLTGGQTAWATRINDDGIVIGYSFDGSSAVGVVWRVVVDGTVSVVDGPVELPPLYAGSGTAVGDINEFVGGAAQVVGTSADEAVLWTIALNTNGTLAMPGAPSPLGTLHLGNPSWSQGLGINNLARVSGDSDSRAFVGSASQPLQSLAVPRNTLSSRGNDLNDMGAIVGYVEIKLKGSNLPVGVNHAYLWNAGKAIDLGTQISSSSGWDLLTAADVISEDGVIGGYGRFDVSRRGFQLVPNNPSGASILSVPEPSAVCLAVIGLAGLATVGRRRAKEVKQQP